MIGPREPSPSSQVPSQALTVRSSKYMVFDKKSIPMVACYRRGQNVKTERPQAGGQKLSHPVRDTASKRGRCPAQALSGFYFAVPHPNSTMNPLVPQRK